MGSPGSNAPSEPFPPPFAMFYLPAHIPLPRWVCAVALLHAVVALAVLTLAFFNQINP